MRLRPPSKPEIVKEGLSVPERMLLFCVVSGTSWQKAGVTDETVTAMVGKGAHSTRYSGTPIAHRRGSGRVPGAAEASLEAVLLRQSRSTMLRTSSVTYVGSICADASRAGSIFGFEIFPAHVE
jgi:hypothetical protein